VTQLEDNDVVIVEAVRSPLGRRNGGLATVHPVDLLVQSVNDCAVGYGQPQPGRYFDGS